MNYESGFYGFDNNGSYYNASLGFKESLASSEDNYCMADLCYARLADGKWYLGELVHKRSKEPCHGFRIQLRSARPSVYIQTIRRKIQWVSEISESEPPVTM